MKPRSYSREQTIVMMLTGGKTLMIAMLIMESDGGRAQVYIAFGGIYLRYFVKSEYQK